MLEGPSIYVPELVHPLVVARDLADSVDLAGAEVATRTPSVRKCARGRTWIGLGGLDVRASECATRVNVDASC